MFSLLLLLHFYAKLKYLGHRQGGFDFKILKHSYVTNRVSLKGY